LNRKFQSHAKAQRKQNAEAWTEPAEFWERSILRKTYLPRTSLHHYPSTSARAAQIFWRRKSGAKNGQLDAATA
jgi:hypothetical protein